MGTQWGNKDRLLTIIIVVLSVSGVLYFGARAVMDQMRTETQNPYALDLSVFGDGPADAPAYSEVQTIPLPAEKLSGLARDQAGFLYVSGHTHIWKYAADGSPVDEFQTGGEGHCLAVDGRGRIYVGMGDHVEVFDRTGVRIAQWESLGPRAIVTSVAVSDSAVYLADAGQRLVWKFSPHGSLLGTYGKKDESKGVPGFILPSPYFDVAIGPDGTPWAANTGRHSLENYSDDGAVRASWGEYGTGIDAFCGCCNPSHFAILSDGAFVTSEKGVPRVKRYDSRGKFTAVVAGTDRFREGVEGLDLAVDDVGRIYVLDPAQKAIRVFSKVHKSEEGTK